jgi:RNA polymerase sigma-70 factor (ECF subfamily)
MTVISDDQVIQSVKDGDADRFGIIVDRYEKPILNFIFRMIQDYDEAQNLTQEVFLRIYETIHRYRGQENFRAFAFTVAKNLSLNHIKKSSRISSMSHLGGSNPEDRVFKYDATQQREMESRFRDDQILAGLKALKENHRLALILKVYLDFSYKQIAEITGWSIPKIETLISRAKAQLKKLINMQENRVPNVNIVRKS